MPLSVLDAAGIWLWPDTHGRYLGRVVSDDRREYRRYMMGHVLAAIPDVPLPEIGQHLPALQQYCLGVGLSPASTNAVTHSVLAGMVRDLALVGKVPSQACAGFLLTPRLQEDKRRRWRPYSVPERDHAIEWFDEHTDHGPLVAFLFLLATRSGEAAGLVETDVEWGIGRVHIDRARKPSGRITLCKEENSQRELWMPTELEPKLERLRGRSRRWFFPGTRGDYLSVPTFRRDVWYPGLKKAGLPRLNLHWCRHSWATTALLSGLTLAEVAAQLGDTPEVAARTYAHVMPPKNVDMAIGRPPLLPSPAAPVPRLRLVK